MPGEPPVGARVGPHVRRQDSRSRVGQLATALCRITIWPDALFLVDTWVLTLIHIQAS